MHKNTTGMINPQWVNQENVYFTRQDGANTHSYKIQILRFEPKSLQLSRAGLR